MDGARFFLSPTTILVIASSINFNLIIVLILIIIITTIVLTSTITAASVTAAPSSQSTDREQEDASQYNKTTTTRLNVINYPTSLNLNPQGQLSSKSVLVIRDPNNMIAKLAETSTSNGTTSSSIIRGKFLLSTAKDANRQDSSKTNNLSSSSQSKRKRAKLLDQLLQTNWSKQSQQSSNLMKLNKMLLVCDANFLDDKSGETPLSLAISSAQINNASHQMLFTSISAHSSSSQSSISSTSNGAGASLHNLQCQVPVHGLGRLELISLQQAGITELIQSKAPLIQRILLLLIKSGALVDFRNSDGRTPLHVAAMKSNYWALKTLLDLGASTDYRDINGLTPLYYSILQMADLKVTQLLLNHNRSPTNQCTGSSCMSGGSISALMSDEARVKPSICTSTTDDHGWQEVHHACKLGLDAHLEALIYYGCDIDAKISGSGNTPLHVAAINDQLNCAKVLLMRGADKTLTNNSHQTAHQVAVVSGNMGLAEFIAQHNDSMMVPFRDSHAPSAQRPSIISSTDVNGAVVGRQSEERMFAMFSSRSSANIKVDSQQPQPPQAQSQTLLPTQPQQRHMNPLSLDVFAPTTNQTSATAASSGSSSNTTNSSSHSLLSIGASRNQSQFNAAHISNISPCLSQRSCATSNTTTSSGVCCDGDGNQSNEEQHNPKEHLSNSHSQHSNVTIISIKNGAVDSATGYGKESSPRTGGDDDDLRSSSDDGNSNGSSSSCADDLYSLMSEQRPLYTGTIVEAVSEYQSGDPNHLQLHRGDLIEVLDYTPELLNAGQLPRLANKPMIFGRRLSDSITGLFPSFCVRRSKHKISSRESKTLRDVTNIEPSLNDDSNTQWPIQLGNENGRYLSESQSMASLDRKSESSFGCSSREDTSRMQYREFNVTLTKKNSGFGFVLRGAKIDSNLTLPDSDPPTEGNQSNNAAKTIIDERMMAANNLISLQYLDEIELTSAANQAGLKRGDFLIAVNGQDVRRSSHEQVVQMIRQSGNQVQLTIATPISLPRAGEQQQQPAYLSKTLTRNKPEPPRRDPTTTLTRNKTQRVKSMIVQPQRQVESFFDADKPLPYVPDSIAPQSPSGSLNISRSISTHLGHFNSVQSLSSSSVIDTQSISSVSTLSGDHQQAHEVQENLPGSQRPTPTHSSSSTTTLTTIAGFKPKAPPKPNLSQLPNSGSQQAIYQPAVVTTSKRPSPPNTSPQNPPKTQAHQKNAPPELSVPPPPPPLPDFSIATPSLNSSNRLIERRTSAPLNQHVKELISKGALLKKRESVAAIGHHPTPDATELGAVAAACAAAANNRLQRQQQMLKQSEEEPQSSKGTQVGSCDKPVVEQIDTTTPKKCEAFIDHTENQTSKNVESTGQPRIAPIVSSQRQSESKDPLPHRQIAAGSLGRKSSAQIIQQPKQMASQSQTLRARTKHQRPSIPDYNELPPPPPPLPSSSEVDLSHARQPVVYTGASTKQVHHGNHSRAPTEQIDIDRQLAYNRRSRDESNVILNNKEEFIRKQQQELIRQQLRQQQLLQQQQLKIQQHIGQHQKCCISANSTHEHHHEAMRYGNNAAAQAYHNHDYSQQALDRLQMMQQQQHPSQPQYQQAMLVSKPNSAHHHRHHHHHNHPHNHPHHSHHYHHHHHNYADSSTMSSGSQQQQQLSHQNHQQHQAPSDLLQQNIYQQHPLHAQVPVMLNHNHVQARAVEHHHRQHLRQQY